MKFRKSVLVMIAASIAASVLVGCGGSGSSAQVFPSGNNGATNQGSDPINGGQDGGTVVGSTGGSVSGNGSGTAQ